MGDLAARALIEADAAAAELAAQAAAQRERTIAEATEHVQRNATATFAALMEPAPTILDVDISAIVDRIPPSGNWPYSPWTATFTVDGLRFATTENNQRSELGRRFRLLRVCDLCNEETTFGPEISASIGLAALGEALKTNQHGARKLEDGRVCRGDEIDDAGVPTPPKPAWRADVASSSIDLAILFAALEQDGYEPRWVFQRDDGAFVAVSRRGPGWLTEDEPF